MKIWLYCKQTDQYEAHCMHDIHLKNQHIPVHHIDIRKFLSSKIFISVFIR